MTTLRDRAERWLASEPDADIASELRDLLGGDDAILVERFTGRLEFGTAGLRAAVGAGPQRMNRLVVRQAAAGLARYLLKLYPDAAERGVVIGYDARRKSDVFASDTARIMAAYGIRSYLFDQKVPTPVVAWAITELNAVAGVVVTASHNPPADNGYKVYLADGAQIVPPHDSGISAQISEVDPTATELASDDDPLIGTVGDDMIDAYVASVPKVRLRPEVDGITVAYSAMHGVGGEILMKAFEVSGFPAPVPVAAQFEPDGSFPTVSFPNPEEPGAMDLLLATAESCGAQLAIANDPDADRLAAAIPTPDGGWRRLEGDEIGWLLADHILANTTGDDRLVITTLVSSSLLSKMAAAAGIESVETFTGFKWIARATLDRPDKRLVFGYEQALGYLVCDQPLDKDGITAAVLFAELAAVAAADGVTLQDRLDDIAQRFGLHRLADAAVRMPPEDGAARVNALRSNPPAEIAGRAVVSTEDYPDANLLRFYLDGGVRIQVRPSGTEPKVKIYGEAVDADPQPFVAGLAELLQSS
ncbi:MAG: phosphomannomutase [Ilumatobacter coccineus]|uniref:Phosphomannomutase n=1 Tax=Ilumatobacter coccineus TaxID=467094 RepID=A0A2G6KBB6_9ACTN|nr:MAG: phosphomannomutase [Ilumatobacter coccineus]